MHPSQTHEPDGLLIIGHGTRDPQGLDEFHALVASIAAMRPAWIVEGAFLELASPSIADGLQRAAERGAERLAVMPLVLFAAGHAKRDIPRQVAAAAARHDRLRAAIGPHLGCHPDIVELSLRRYAEATGPGGDQSDSQTLLLMVGRGSRDAEANAEMARFARLRYERRPTGWIELAFTALAPPSLQQALEVAARLPFARVVVQPHLLLRGELLERLRRTVSKTAESARDYNWMVTGHLGPDRLVAEAVLSLVGGVQFQPRTPG